jgi:hypothetical protein
MGSRKQDTESEDDGFDSSLVEALMDDFTDETDEGPSNVSCCNRAQTEKRRLVELRLEERRLREELGDYDLEF